MTSNSEIRRKAMQNPLIAANALLRLREDKNTLRDACERAMVFLDLCRNADPTIEEYTTPDGDTYDDVIDALRYALEEGE